MITDNDILKMSSKEFLKFFKFQINILVYVYGGLVLLLGFLIGRL